MQPKAILFLEKASGLHNIEISPKQKWETVARDLSVLDNPGQLSGKESLEAQSQRRAQGCAACKGLA